MRTSIKTLTVFSALLASAALAGAQEQQRPERPAQRPAEFECPICGSPCVSKAQMVRQIRARQLQTGQQVRPNQPAMKRQQLREEQDGNPQQPRQQLNREQRGQALNRFDFDGDGQLSMAEKAARRAYREALIQEQGKQPKRPARQPPIEE